MTAFSSMQYTIGTALERAREGGHVVEILVDNHWVSGLVAASDGLGVVLDNNGIEHCIVRLERISAVRVSARAPMLQTAVADRLDDDLMFSGAMPMPGPRLAAD
ncbi:MAG: hypothetical protein ACXV2J_04565 [Actinomycetes bacterium]